MKTAVIIFCLFASVLSWASCLDSLAEFKSRGAEHSIFEYDEQFVRVIEEYADGFGPEFVASYNRLKKGDAWADLGAGSGLAVLQGVVHKGLVGYAFNSQDFWDHFFRAGGDLRWNGSEQSPSKLGYFSGSSNVPMELIFHLAKEFEPERDWEGLRRLRQELYKELLLKALFKARNQLVEFRNSGQFHYLTSLVQNHLGKFPKTFRLVTDYYGAFFYSTNRAGLLGQVYKSLNSGGEAYFLFGHSLDGISNFKIKDIVIDKGTPKNLIDYLVEKHPSIFSKVPFATARSLKKLDEDGRLVSTNERIHSQSQMQVLKMRRPFGVKPLVLNIYPTATIWQESQVNKSFIVPIQTYQVSGQLD